MNYFKCESIRLCRYLYSLGFEKESSLMKIKKNTGYLRRLLIYKKL
nr:MAG TPA: hypothetical protein [Caudoviricetes sp.]